MSAVTAPETENATDTQERSTVIAGDVAEGVQVTEPVLPSSEVVEAKISETMFAGIRRVDY